jgi:hypothetical protein
LIGLALAPLMLVAVPATSAVASSEVRFVNASGGSDPLRLEVDVGGQRVPAGGPTAFGDATDHATVPSGDAQLSLVAGAGSNAGATLDKVLADAGSYTVVALPDGQEDGSLVILRDGTAAAGEAKLRVLHAAPELGDPDVRLGDRTLAEGLGFRSDTGYMKVDPGSYKLAVAAPDGGDAVLEMPIAVAAGTASTVIVAGTGGSEARLIELTDDTLTPPGAPDTGLGGLAERDLPWLAALIAALLAGTLGGAIQTARTRRAQR